MAGQFNYKINIDADLSKLQNQLKQATSEFSKINPTVGTKFIEGFSNIEAQINRLRNKLQAPITSKGEYDNLVKDLAKVQTQMDQLEKSYQKLSKGDKKSIMSILPQNELANIEKATALFKKIAGLREKISRDTGELKRQQALTEEYKTQARELDKQIAALQKRANSYDKSKAKLDTKTHKLYEQYGSGSTTGTFAQLQEMKKSLNQQKGTVAKDSAEYRQIAADLRQVNDLLKEYNTLKVQRTQDTGSARGSYDKTLSAYTENYQIFIKQAEQAEQAVKSLQQALNKESGANFSKAFGNTLSELSKIKGLDLSGIKDIQDIDKLVERIGKLDASGYERAISLIDGLKGKVETTGPEIARLQNYLNGLSSGFNRLDRTVGDLQMWENRLNYAFSLYNGYRLLTQQMKKAFEAVKELDKAMTETAIVTNFSVGDMWAKLPEYTEQANALGVSVTEMYNAATLYYQQGLKENQVMALSVETMKMARIAGLEASDATDRKLKSYAA